jgi:prefoldin subunit 5
MSSNQPELEHLSQSFGQLRQARNKFLDCIKSINSGGREEHEGSSFSASMD